MSRSKKYIILIILYIGLALSCDRDNKVAMLLAQIDSEMDTNPENALSTLKSIFSTTEMSDEDFAYYAILNAAATDKNKGSLMSCDSLLNHALIYYEDNRIEKARVLLYKGRLEDEIVNRKEAVKNYHDALTILDKYPDERKIRKLVYSSLGRSYLDAGLYDEARSIYIKMKQFYELEKDKSSLYNNLSFIYLIDGKNDSTLILQHKAIDNAIAAKEPELIVTSKYNMSLYFSELQQPDSAFFYAQDLLNDITPQIKDKSMVFHNLGILFNEKEEYDSARYFLEKSLLTTNLEYKSYSLKELYQIEKKTGNHEKATGYLEEYVLITDSLQENEQASEIQQLVYKHNTSIRIAEEQIKSKRILTGVVTGFIIICFIMIILYQNRINRKKQQQLLYQVSLEKAQQKLTALQSTIDDNMAMINYLQHEYNYLQQGQSEKEKQINERERTIEQLKEEKYRLRNWLFGQSDIYKKIITLSSWKVSDRKQMKVLSTEDQKKLKNVLFDIYAEYINTLKSEYPRLTDSDLLLLCLQETSLDSLSIAICFGYTNTHPINQRKLRIREKMKFDDTKCDT